MRAAKSACGFAGCGPSLDGTTACGPAGRDPGPNGSPTCGLAGHDQGTTLTYGTAGRGLGIVQWLWPTGRDLGVSLKFYFACGSAGRNPGYGSRANARPQSTSGPANGDSCLNIAAVCICNTSLCLGPSTTYSLVGCNLSLSTCTNYCAKTMSINNVSKACGFVDSGLGHGASTA